ncbi:hypothetical protein [Aureimonas sp. SA4125]|uniref:hypothetical protein n=1 Tax=Aureimonas sp. SA4125 TaxID=2826993 RepID=UPI001CC6AAC4|nr:hypothetical protein [Aureimonas sp. SA4125]
MLVYASAAVCAADDLTDQVQRCLTMPQGTKNTVPPLEIRVDAAGAVLDIGTIGEPPVALSRRFAIEEAARSIRRCSPFVVPGAGIYPVTIGAQADGRNTGGNSFDPLRPIPRQDR